MENNKPIPFFIKNRILLSYKYTLMLLILFGIFYWGPLLYESNFDLNNSQYGILQDVAFYFFPLFFMLIVLISKNIRDGINKYFDIEHKKNGEKKDENNLQQLVGKENFENLEKIYYKLTSRTNEVVLSVIMILFIVVGSNGLFWTTQGFAYRGVVVTNSIVISSITLLLIGIFLALDAASGILYLLSFIIIVASTKILLKKKNPFKIYSIEKKDSDEESEGMSYANFYSNYKEISDFITVITFEILLSAMVFSIVFIANEIINVQGINYLLIALLIVFPLLIFLLFLYPQIRIFFVLKGVKKASQNAFNEKYFEKQKEFFKILNVKTKSPEQKIQELEELERVLGILTTIQEKEEKVPIWPINIQIIVSMLATLVPTIVGFAVQLL